MKMQDQDEFKKAFMTDAAEGEPDGGEGMAADPAMAEEQATVAADPAIDAESAGNESDGNGPTDDAAEGSTGEPAAAVVLNAEGDDDASDVPAEDMQAYKSWRGRLKKREEALAAREAALAGAGGEQEPAMLADGGKAGGKDGEKWDRLKAQEYMVHDAVVEGPDGEEQVTGNGSIVQLENDKGEAVHTTDGNRDRMWGGDGEKLVDDFNSAPKHRMADGGEVDGEPAAAPAADDADAMLASFAEDYSPDFVAAIEKLVDKRARAIVEEMGGAYVNDLSARIDQVVDAANDNMGRMHGDVLRALREDAEEIANSPEFQAWVDGLEGEDQMDAKRIVESGNLKEVLGLFKQYDGAKGGKERSPEDIWLEDAAAGVKGSAPIKLPTRAPANPEDEYKAAWQSM